MTNMIKLNHLRITILIAVISGLFALFGCERNQPTADQAEKESTVNETSVATTSTPSDAGQQADKTAKVMNENAPPELNGQALDDAIAALRKKVNVPTGDGTSPYQIQLGVDDTVISTMIGEKPNLDYIFTNQDGKAVNIATSYPGKVLVISTIYTSCPMPEMCPRLTSDFASLAASVPDELKDFVQFILVSFDPQRDTPKVLKAFGEQHGIDFAHTDLLCGPLEQTKALMDDALRIPLDVNPETNMIITHAMLLDIINRDGFVVVEHTVATSEPMATISKEIVRAVLLPFDPAKVPVDAGEGG